MAIASILGLSWFLSSNAFGASTDTTAALPDSGRGELLYESRCSVCHSLDANRVGPKHQGLHGRRAGGVEGFDYSPALQKSEVIWTDDTIDRWLENPQGFIPGQRMNIRVPKATDRADIIAYLKRQSGDQRD
ncbi:MAG: c-type cytochrome [Alphaproteobacteria bacterium]|nr:c-type cytochrome [Alphaproteobacteria bacterium]